MGLARRGRQRPGALLGLRVRRRCATAGRRRARRVRGRGRRARHLGRRRRAAAADQRAGHRRAPVRARARRLPPDLRAPRSTSGVRFLLDHLPRAGAPRDRDANRAAGGRRAPARARRAGEIASEQLRFSDAEAAALLNETLGARAAATDQLALLSARTEGWAAGLYLAGLSLRDRPGAARRARSFAYDRHLVDYLGDEVVSAQDPQARSFLVDTCVLDRFCAPLCDAVRGEGGSKALLTRSSAPTSSSCRSTSTASGFATTTSSATCCAASSRTPARPSTSPSCTRAPGRGAPQAGDVSAAVGHLLAAGREAAARRSDRRRRGTRRCRAGRSATVDALARRARARRGAPPTLGCASPGRGSRSTPASRSRPSAGPHATAAADDGRPLPDGGATVGLRRRDAARDAGLPRGRPQPPPRQLGAQAVELEREPRLAVARGRAGHARRGAPLPRRALRRRSCRCSSRPWRCARSGANSMAVLRAQGTLAAVTFAAGDRDGGGRLGGGGRRAARAAVARGVLDGLAGDRGRGPARRATPATSRQARERLERAVVLARRGAARPEQIYALAALAPIQATLGDADAAAATLRDARLALRGLAEPGHVRAPAQRRRSPPARPGRERPARSRSSPRARCRSCGCCGSELSIADIGAGALHLAQHGQDPRARDLPQARRRHARRPPSRAPRSCACSDRPRRARAASRRARAHQRPERST